MFETIVVSILDKYLGVYVTNFDSKQLNIGIWGGDVELTNLYLKGSAFDVCLFYRMLLLILIHLFFTTLFRHLISQFRFHLAPLAY